MAVGLQDSGYFLNNATTRVMVLIVYDQRVMVLTIGTPMLDLFIARFFALLFFALLTVSTGNAFANDSANHYRLDTASADGIGKFYMGREIARVMGFEGAAWLERDEREREERSDLLLLELGLKPGMVVADIGAGTGYYSRRIAALVGPSGKVYAVDVQPEMINMIEADVKRLGLSNVVPVLGGVDDVKLPNAVVDVAIMVDVYHELEFPFETLHSIVRALKPGGRVVFLEYRAEDPNVPIKRVHKMSEAQVRREAGQHSLVWERTVKSLPWQHMVMMRKK